MTAAEQYSQFLVERGDALQDMQVGWVITVVVCLCVIFGLCRWAFRRIME